MLDAIVSAVVSFFVDVVLTGIFYWPGWIVLRAVTLGRYPPRKGQDHNTAFVAMIGFAVALVTTLVAFGWIP